ncbi:MAG: hypothetical protein WCY19_05840 [Candidatus Gastranaerophilaceae bacterium]
MSIDAVSSVASSSVATSAARSSSSTLSDDTKKKLQALGLDPSKYTSETQAQLAIKDAQEKQEGTKKSGGSNPLESIIKTEVNSLASAMGIEIGSNDKLDDILNKISTQLTTLQASAGTDGTKLSNVNNYQNQFATITSELSQLEAARKMTGATALANYNKAALGLAA